MMGATDRNSGAAPEVGGKAAGTRSVRMVAVDRLRVVLAIMVICQHLLITFGGPGYWYLEDPASDDISGAILALFTAIIEACALGCFFALAGFFAERAYLRKGTWRFLRGRLIRLGIPMLIYDVVLSPPLEYVRAVQVLGFNGSIPEFLVEYRDTYLEIGNGPVWFLERLLVFSVIYVIVRPLFATPESKQQHPASKRRTHLWLTGLAIGIGALTFIQRLWLPALENIKLLTIECPLIPPQYVVMFVFGIIAQHRGWWIDYAIPNIGRGWLVVLLISCLALAPAVLVIGGGLEGDVGVFMGGATWQALLYATWEQFVCLGALIGLLYLLDRPRKEGSRSANLARSCYAAYVFHPALIVPLGLLMQKWPAPSLVKAGLAIVVAVPLSVAMGALLRRLPGLKRVL